MAQPDVGADYQSVHTRLSTDANEIIAFIRPLIAADPVRHTVLGSVAQVLQEPQRKAGVWRFQKQPTSRPDRVH